MSSTLTATDGARGAPAPSSANVPDPVDEGFTASQHEQSAIHSPPHYTVGGIETRDFIAAKRLNFNRVNVVKYTVRAGLKDPAAELEDLLKAKSYLDDEIVRVRQAAFVLPTPVYSCTFPTDDVSRGLRELRDAEIDEMRDVFRGFGGVVEVDLSDCGDR